MSYFDPETYNTENLSEKDRQEIEFWKQTMEDAIDSVIMEIEEENADNGSETLAKIENELAKCVGDRIKENLDFSIKKIIVSRIDNYTEEEFETYKAAAEARKKEDEES